MRTNILVIMNVVTKIQTDAETTACVVALPTPWVPPVVRMPYRQPTSEMIMANAKGFTRPCTRSLYSSACQAEVQYWEAVIESRVLAMILPPISPMKSAMMVSNGSTTAIAINLGVTSF